MSVIATNPPLFDALRKLFPELPERCTKLTLQMQEGCIPLMSVTHQISELKPEAITETFELVQHHTALRLTHANSGEVLNDANGS